MMMWSVDCFVIIIIIILAVTRTLVPSHKSIDDGTVSAFSIQLLSRTVRNDCWCSARSCCCHPIETVPSLAAAVAEAEGEEVSPVVTTSTTKNTITWEHQTNVNIDDDDDGNNDNNDDPLFTIIDDYNDQSPEGAAAQQQQQPQQQQLPIQIAYPHNYVPHPVAIHACNKLREELLCSTKYSNYSFHDDDDDGGGKMFGILIVKRNGPDGVNQLGYLKAYSGTIKTPLLGFCPLVYDRFAPVSDNTATITTINSTCDGGTENSNISTTTTAAAATYFCYKAGEEELNTLNRQVELLENDPERVMYETDLVRIRLSNQHQLDQVRVEQKMKKQRRKVLRQNYSLSLLPHEPTKYREVEEQLQQESAADQRYMKAVKKQFDDNVAQLEIKLYNNWNGPLARLKERRRLKSAELQNGLFEQYQFLNSHGEKASLLDIFRHTPIQRPPSGAGDCAAPKLFQYAFARGYTPVAMAEFWWDPNSNRRPANETIRKHNYYYPACRGKCEPILQHMLKGLDVGVDPALDTDEVSMKDELLKNIEIVYEDDYMLVVNKPPDVLSVPGRLTDRSVYSRLKQLYPNADGPLLVHRLDMSTSGLLLVAKDKDTHKHLSKQFINRSVKKRYESLLDGVLVLDTDTDAMANGPRGKIELPLIGDYLNRPMQKVDFQNGKPAVTFFEVIGVETGGIDECNDGVEKDSRSGHTRTRIYFYPLTGRTHQLRVHAAHPLGLNLPIVGDDIYGQRRYHHDVEGGFRRRQRLCLHAGLLQITHPVTGKRITFRADAPF